jgi:hypothetical protein
MMIHVDVDHLVIFKKIEEVINNAMKRSLKRQPTKKKNAYYFSISYFFCFHKTFQIG